MKHRKKKTEVDTAVDHLAEQQDLLEACFQHIDAKHSILWGRAFDLSQQSSRREAAEWFASEISEVLAL